MGVVFANKDIKAVEDDDDGKVYECKPSCEWLELAPENESIAVNSLSFERFVELQVRYADGAPCEEGCNGGQVLEPVEHNGWATRVDGQVCKPGNGSCNADAPVWNTGLATAEKEAWGLLILSKSEEISRSGVQERVRRRRGGRQDHGIDNTGQNWDASIPNTNNPWGLRSTGSTRSLCTQQALVIGGNKDTNCERAKNVEEQNTPEDSANGLGNILSGILGLTSSNSNKFHTTVRKCGVHEDGEETQEPSSGSSGIIFLHGSWMLPVSEAQTIVLWSTAKIHNEGHDQETNDGNDLHTGKDELCLTVYLDGEDI